MKKGLKNTQLIIVAVDRGKEKEDLCYVTSRDVVTGKEWSSHMTQKALKLREFMLTLILEHEYDEDLLDELCSYVVDLHDEDLSYKD